MKKATRRLILVGCVTIGSSLWWWYATDRAPGSPRAFDLRDAVDPVSPAPRVVEGDKRVPVGGALLAVDVHGLPKGVPVLVSCLEVGDRLLWREEVSANEAITMSVPTGRPLLVFTEATTGAPRREVRVRVDQQQTQRVVLDYSATWDVRFVCLAQGGLPASCPVEVFVSDQGVQTVSGQRIRGEFDEHRQLTLRMDPGTIASLQVAGVSLVDATTRADRFFAVPHGTYVVQATSPLCVVRSRKDPDEPLVGFSQATGVILPTSGALYVNPRGLSGGDLLVVSRSGWQTVPYSRFSGADTVWVNLDEAWLGLHIIVSGDVAPGLELLLTGPIGGDVPMLGIADIRQRRIAVGLRRAFEVRPLVPGDYELRWFLPDALSASGVIATVTVQPGGVAPLVVEAEGSRVRTAVFRGVERLLAFSGRTYLGIHNQKVVDSSSRFSIPMWDGAGITHVRVGGMEFDDRGIPVVATEMGGDTTALELSPRAAFLEVHVEPALGGILRFYPRTSRVASTSESGEFRFVSEVGRQVQLVVYEDVDAREHYRGTLCIDVERPHAAMRFSMPGRWVDLSVSGRAESFRVEFSGQGREQFAGRVVGGCTTRIWVPRDVTGLTMTGRDGQRHRLPVREEQTTVSVDVSAW